jgi:hypothetical protein
VGRSTGAPQAGRYGIAYRDIADAILDVKSAGQSHEPG